MTEQEGWLLVGGSLYWTRDAGSSWSEITPPVSGTAVILSVTFSDPDHGWVLFYRQDLQVENQFILTSTSSAGKEWSLENLHLFSPGDPESVVQAGYLEFIDPNNGWLVLRPSSSSNFNLGVLFRTEDGGLTWERGSIPFGEPVHFISQSLGWTSGGEVSEELYRSHDGGRSWQLQEIQELSQKTGVSTRYENPKFATPLRGFLPVVIRDGVNTTLQVYFTDDGGSSWQANRAPQNIAGFDSSVDLPFAILDQENAILAHPDTGQVYRAQDSGEVTISALNSPMIPAIQKLVLVSPTVGWGVGSKGSCQPVISTVGIPSTTGARTCVLSQGLLRTTDGGRSWETLSLPEGMDEETKFSFTPLATEQESQATSVLAGPTSGKRIVVTTGQGFDKCEIPTLDKLQAWIRNSPYDAVNLYIGGATRSCSNQALSAAYLSQLSQQGWKFIPTWVGPQASCYKRDIAKMSDNPVVSRQEGIAEANAAIEKAYSLGLTLADKSGAVIYYNLESYDRANTSCHNAAKAFIEGWSIQMRARGNIAGVYSSGPILNDFFGLAEKPDVIWPAHWKTSNYDPNATVWDVYYLSNDYWKDHQRLRQYAGGHSETWGNVSLTIDSDVLDGVVTVGKLQDDDDNNGKAEVFSVQKSGGQSGRSEIYVLNGATNFSSLLKQQTTALPWTNDGWLFDIADFDNDGWLDLYAIHNAATSSGKTELLILSGASAYQSAQLSLATILPQSTPGAWTYLTGNFDQDGIPDLYAIDHQGSGKVTLHVLSGASGYQTLAASLPTQLNSVGASGAWGFALADYNQDHISDLVGINKSLGASNQTEISILNGVTNMQTFLVNAAPSALAKTGNDNSWVFFLRDHNFDGTPDLFAINKTGGIQGMTAVHILDGASQFSTWLLSAPSALPLTGADCRWDFLSGQCYAANPATVFTKYLPLLFR